MYLFINYPKLELLNKTTEVFLGLLICVQISLHKGSTNTPTRSRHFI